jgi:WD40 repeat protein
MLAVLREVEPPGVPRGWAHLVGKALRSPRAREERSWGGSVFGAAWSPDGQRIVAALLDGTARVWKLGDPGEPIVLLSLRSIGYASRRLRKNVTIFSSRSFWR